MSDQGGLSCPEARSPFPPAPTESGGHESARGSLGLDAPNNTKLCSQGLEQTDRETSGISAAEGGVR